MGFKISLCKFQKNSLSERLLKAKSVTLWVELTEHKAVSQKASFQFLTGDIPFFTIVVYGLPSITLPVPQEQSYRKASWRENCNSVRRNNRTQSNFSEWFFQVFVSIFSFSPQPSMRFQISLCQFHKNSLSERLLEGKAITLWDELTEHKGVSLKPSFQFLTEDISFFTIALHGLPNITLQITQEQT